MIRRVYLRQQEQGTESTGLSNLVMEPSGPCAAWCSRAQAGGVTVQVVVLGAGFGGLELSSLLSERLAGDVAVTLIDQDDAFVFGFSRLEILFGRQTRDEVRLPYRDLAKPGVEFRQETVVHIDPERRRVTTDAATYDADFVVVALGADYDVPATPGFAEGGFEYYSVDGANGCETSWPASLANHRLGAANGGVVAGAPG